jgi:hypothetical protein
MTEAQALERGGFRPVGEWMNEDGKIKLNFRVPSHRAVRVFREN